MKMKQNNRIFLLVIASLLITFTAAAQAKIIHGQVTAKSDKLPIIGVSVAEYDASNRILNGTITDFDGNYTLRISGTPTNRVVYSYVGYKTVTRTAGNGGNINIVMEDATQTIKEVNVTARRQVSTGNINIAERDLTFAMSKIETKELEGLQAASIDEALQGRMSGVDIVANSGEPGSGMSIRIRGTTSINSGSDPMIVVDGIPFETNIGSDFDFATADEENYAQLLNISPADIEEINTKENYLTQAEITSKEIIEKWERSGKPIRSASWRASSPTSGSTQPSPSSGAHRSLSS